MKLASDRQSAARICIPAAAIDDRDSSVNFAAGEMRYYLERITCAVFDIAEEENAAPGGIHIARAEAGFDDDEFEIDVTDDRVSIRGGERGVLYGVYEFLERIGVRFFTHNCEKVPSIPTLDIAPYSARQKPAFEYRDHNYADVVQNPRFAAKCRFNGILTSVYDPSLRRPRFLEKGEKQRVSSPYDALGGRMSYAGAFVHSFDRILLPAAEFGAEHPEYFALVNGKRVTGANGRNQPCLTNPDVLRIVIERTRRLLQENPRAKIVSVSQNDWGDHCQCPECKRINEEEGSAAGTMLRFVNAVAEALEPEFPDIIFDTLAYQHTRPTPRHVRNRHNVCVRLCSIECCFSHPFATCDDARRAIRRPDGTTSNFITDLRNWGKVCDRIYIWDYTTCFAHYPMPHANWRVLQPNVREMAANNVKGVFEQACGASRGSTDFNELRLYLISKLLWDPDCDIERHRREFMEHYYGAAAPFLQEYLDLLCDTVERQNIHIGFNDNPLHPHFDETMLDKYDALFDKAAQAVAGDPLRLWRVERNRLSIRWVRLKRATMLRNEFDNEAINAFFADWRAFNMSRIDEWVNIERTHRALLDRKWRGTEYLEHWTLEGPEYL